MSKLIQSYVDDKYFVSTILREFNIEDVPFCMRWGYETIVWQWDNIQKQRMDMIYQTSTQTSTDDSKSEGFNQHMQICEKLLSGIKCDLGEN